MTEIACLFGLVYGGFAVEWLAEKLAAWEYRRRGPKPVFPAAVTVSLKFGKVVHRVHQIIREGDRNGA